MTDASDDLIDGCCRRGDPAASDPGEGLLPASMRSGLLSMRIALAAPPGEVWGWLTRPDLLARWSPVVPDRPLLAAGPAEARESPLAESVDATVLEVFAPFRLVHRWGPDTLTWQLGPAGAGSQLQLVHHLSDRDSYAGAAAGWHLCLGVLEQVVGGRPAERLVGAEAMSAGWASLRDAYRDRVVPNDADG